MTTNYDVLINGGGPVGMGLAIELGLRGVRCCVVERSAEPSPIPKGQNLTQRTCEHFRAWGCEDEIRNAHPLPKGAGIGGMTCYGTLLSDYHYDWLNRKHVGDFYFSANARLPQYATERVLRARAAQVPDVEILYGWEGHALDLRPDGVTLEVSRDGASRFLDGKYVVGCDGSRSMVRHAAGIPETRSEHNRLMALLVFRSEELHELLQRHPGKAFYNVLHPDQQGYWQFFGRVDHGLSWFFHAPVPFGTTPDNFDFRALLHRAVGQPFALEFDHVGLWDLRISMADTYRSGRAFIAGDAAHSHPPYGGYGINIGFEDARNLGWKLAAILAGWGGDALLDSYDAERHPVFASTARDFIERYIEEDRSFLERFAPDRDPAAFEQAWYARNLDADEVNAFEPNYAGSPIVAAPGECSPGARGAHSFEARPGHLLPPPGVGGRERCAQRPRPCLHFARRTVTGCRSHAMRRPGTGCPTQGGSATSELGGGLRGRCDPCPSGPFRRLVWRARLVAPRHPPPSHRQAAFGRSRLSTQGSGLHRVLITGAASGIGRRTAELFREAGVHVTAVDRKDPGAAADRWLPTDLGEPRAALPRLEGPFQALVSAAGLPPRIGDERAILAVNFLGLRRFTRHAFDKLEPDASIVHVASKAGARWRENIAQVRRLIALGDDADPAVFVAQEKIDPVRAYDLSKEAVIVWSKAATGPLIRRGLRMNCVSPAAVDTPILGDFMAAFGDRASRGVELTCRAGRPEEIARAIMFLCSPASGWIRGCNIECDGGLTAQLETEQVIDPDKTLFQNGGRLP